MKKSLLFFAAMVSMFVVLPSFASAGKVVCNPSHYCYEASWGCMPCRYTKKHSVLSAELSKAKENVKAQSSKLKGACQKSDKKEAKKACTTARISFRRAMKTALTATMRMRRLVTVMKAQKRKQIRTQAQHKGKATRIKTRLLQTIKAVTIRAKQLQAAKQNLAKSQAALRKVLNQAKKARRKLGQGTFPSSLVKKAEGLAGR